MEYEVVVNKDEAILELYNYEHHYLHFRSVLAVQ